MTSRSSFSLHRYLVAIPAALLLAGILTAGSALSAQSNAPWYRRSRALDLTGANPRDSVVLTAVGPRPDQLRITLAFYVDGAVVHTQRWPAEDELYEADSVRKSPTLLATHMRKRLDQVLSLVRREHIDFDMVKHMGDEKVLRTIVPRPTHSVTYAFAFETAVFMAWDAKRRRMVVFMECC